MLIDIGSIDLSCDSETQMTILISRIYESYESTIHGRPSRPLPSIVLRRIGSVQGIRKRLLRHNPARRRPRWVQLGYSQQAWNTRTPRKWITEGPRTLDTDFCPPKSGIEKGLDHFKSYCQSNKPDSRLEERQVWTEELN